MAVVRCDFFAQTLGIGLSMTVILPQPEAGRIGAGSTVGGGDPPVLYLLHGLSDDDTAWLRWTSVERYAEKYGLAVVMPQVHRSFYSDEVHGHRYFTFLSEELPSLTHRFFRLSARREDTFVAGLSMGGYGAVKWALHQPERFAAVASLSGALDVAARQANTEWQPDPPVFERVFGDASAAGTDADLFHRLDLADKASLPKVFLCCGTEDALLEDNELFAEACRAKGLDPTVHFGPGEHEWGYWDRTIQDVLAWLPIRGV